MKASRVALIILVLAACFVALQYLQRPKAAAPETVPATAVTPPAQESPAVRASMRPRPEIEAPAGSDAPGCLTRRELEDSLLSGPDAQRLHAVSVGGPDFEAYRGLDDASLRAYADQGDAAAMAIMGANAVMRAYDRSESGALPWLNDEQSIYQATSEGMLTAEASLELNDAAYWFYQAALHGRVYALVNYGIVRNRLFSGPVGLGWLSQEEFDTMDEEQRVAWQVENVYRQAVYDIAPQLGEGTLGSIQAEMAGVATGTESLLRIREDIANEFERSLLESELPPLNIPPTSAPLNEDFRSQLCASEGRQPDSMGLTPD